jgi:hypothetical protein
LIRPKALAAPETENDIRGAAYDFAGIAENAILGQSTDGALGKHVIAAGAGAALTAFSPSSTPLVGVPLILVQ